MMQNQEQTSKFQGRGKPAAGFRLTIGRRLAIEEARKNGVELDLSSFSKPKQDFVSHLIKQKAEMDIINPHVSIEETFEDIKAKVKARFDVMTDLVLSTAMNINPSLIISGASGVGKSTTVKNTIDSLGLVNAKFVSGKISPVGLFKLLYTYREQDSVLVLDDSDSVFDDDVSIDLLKAATDSTDIRLVSWHSNRTMQDEDGDDIPNDFEFNGSIIFISNMDIYKEASSNNKQAPHFQALISRSFVLDLSMKNKDYYLARIEDVLYNSMDESIMNLEVKDRIYKFMTEEKNNLRELSLRMVKKLHVLMLTYNNDWESKAKILLCK